MKYIRLVFWVVLSTVSMGSWAQSNWKTVADTTLFNQNDTAKVWRSGAVSISQQYASPFNNMLLVTTKYDTLLSRGIYVGINEPRYDLESPDSTTVGLATESYANSQGLIVNNYANYKSGMTFPDVHTTTSEFNFLRGFPDSLGFRDGGHISKVAAIRATGTFANNGRNYKTDAFDLINLRFFNSSTAGNMAEIENFYGLRLEDFRGVNPAIIKNGWGVYIAPNQLKNYFSGQVGIGTTVIAHALTVAAPADPVQLTGLTYGAEQEDVLTIDDKGVVHRRNSGQRSFLTTTDNTTLSPEIELYIHKGGDAVFEVPPAPTRAGQTWKIVNIGTGTITLSRGFFVGNSVRYTIPNDEKQYIHEIFSDGETYVAIH
ncbi:hypothetical protein [Arundinibacter roseus]|uniref:Uncharacterized protein n=1 Tax=Arundinibacter roseus TaxID=2070510 RepID=A0A4V2XAJ7_9BACT|nr:hypothetical protein [Arundinibacter roseus]TDB67885.1 hypothetical protein EZE20_02875 [Arundinibacter roseus]